MQFKVLLQAADKMQDLETNAKKNSTKQIMINKMLIKMEYDNK